MPPSPPGFISALLFLWTTPFIKANVKVPLTAGRLLPLPDGQSSGRETESLLDGLAARSGRWRLHRALLFQYRREIGRVFLIAAVLLASSLAGPLLLRALIQTLEGRAPELLAGIAGGDMLRGTGRLETALLLAFSLFLTSLLHTLSVHHLFYRQLILAMRAKLAISGAVYRTALTLHREERAVTTSGFIINLVSVDAQRIHFFFMMLHSSLFHPIQIFCVLYLLYSMLGAPALYGAAVITGILGGCASLTRLQARIRRELQKVSDQRVGLMNEVLSFIKTVKFSAWEEYLSNRVGDLRDREISIAKRLTLLSALISFATASSPVLAMVVIFYAHVARGGQLDAALIFPTLALLMTLRFAIAQLPDTFFSLVETHVSATRLSAFFALKRWQPLLTSGDLQARVALEDAAFSWGTDREALRVKSLSVMPGELVAVVGRVGSGKTALLLGILGELRLVRGTVERRGEIAYVAQNPWIVSDTVRNNVLCGRQYEPQLYEHVLAASALGPDLVQFPRGDETEIGERGINLSGGQRQRLALARALYAQADIYLLDDPLSALDPSVANQVFDRLIEKDLKHAARILVTHRLEYALRADRVVVIDDGRVVAAGTPEILKREAARFRELFEFHSQSHGHEYFSIEAGTLNPAEPTDRADEPGEGGDQSGVGTGSVSQIITAEDREIGSIDRAVLAAYRRRFVPGLALLLLFLIFVGRQLAAVGADLRLVEFSGRAGFTLTEFLYGYLPVVLVLCTLNFARSLFVLMRGLIAGRQSHAALLQGVLRAPLRFFESNPVGRILNRFSRDLETVDSVLPRSILDACGSLFETFTVLFVVAVIQPLTLLVFAPVLVLYLRLQKLFRPTSREGQRLDSITRSPIFAQLSESLAGVETIRAFSRGDLFVSRMYQHLDLNARAFYSLVCANRWLGLRLEALGALIVLSAAVSAAFLVESPWGPALSGFMVTYAMNITGSMNWLVRMFAQIESNLTSFERIETYASLSPERQSAIEPPAGWPNAGAIAFHDVSFRYRRELAPALQSVTLRIDPGERIGIVGRTGSGKSTLVLGLLRLLEPMSGAIEIDGIDIGALSLNALRSSIIVIPQEPVLLSGTMRENIDPRAAYTDSEVWSSLERVGLRDFITALPRQLDSQIEEGGSNLSSGQRQLVCLARALLRKSRIIVMDEATAQIDVESDVLVQRAIRREFREATVLIIAHRLGSVMDADRVLVFDAGRLKEFGKPEELLCRESGLFRSLVHEIRLGSGHAA